MRARHLTTYMYLMSQCRVRLISIFRKLCLSAIFSKTGVARNWLACEWSCAKTKVSLNIYIKNRASTKLNFVSEWRTVLTTSKLKIKLL